MQGCWIKRKPSWLRRAEGEVNTVIQGLEEQRQRQQAAAEDAAALLARTELLHEELLLRWQQQKQQTALHQEQGRQRLEAFHP